MATALRPHRSYWEHVADTVAGREGYARQLGFNPQMVPVEHRYKVFPELAPKPQPKRRVRRSPRPFAMKMRKVEAGVYETLDGAWRVEHCFYDHYCDQAHPVRTGRGRGEMCPGDQWHTIPAWQFQRRLEGGGYMQAWLSGLDVVSTLREAVEIVKDNMTKEEPQ